MTEYERFEQQESKPMFRKQGGILGVLFIRSQSGCAVLSVWKDAKSIELLASSESYQQTVDKLTSTGLLKGAQTVEVFEVKDGFLSPDILSRISGK